MLAKMYKFSCWITETEPAVLIEKYVQLLQKAGFKIVNSCAKYFEPQGFTALYLLAESHLAIHTFPERGKTYIELSSCVQVPFERFCELHNFEETESD